MKIIFIIQGPHPVHKAWLKSVTNHFVTYIPNFLSKIKRCRDFIYAHTILNQILSCFNRLPPADIYVVEGFKTILPAILNRRKKTKIILINSDPFFMNYKKQNCLVKKIYKWYIKHVDYFICTSSMIKNLTLEYSNAPSYIVYPFVNTTKFHNLAKSLNSPNICSISTARYTGGADFMVRIFKKFNKEYPTSKLFVCDWGEKNYLNLLRQDPNIITPGFCDPTPYLAKSGLYLNASRFDAFGINILEAMCAGIPPIISKFCGAKDLVEKVDKTLVCNLDEGEMFKKLLELHRNKKRKVQLSEKCKKIAFKYNKQRSVDNFNKVFEQIQQSIIKKHQTSSKF